MSCITRPSQYFLCNSVLGYVNQHSGALARTRKLTHLKKLLTYRVKERGWSTLICVVHCTFWTSDRFCLKAPKEVTGRKSQRLVTKAHKYQTPQEMRPAVLKIKGRASKGSRVGWLAGRDEKLTEQREMRWSLTTQEAGETLQRHEICLRTTWSPTPPKSTHLNTATKKDYILKWKMEK